MCFDCHKELNNLDYFDLKNGNFLCAQCAQNHANFENDTVQPMTGNLRTLEEKDLLMLYYGGNKNLYNFIKEYFPLLENMKIKDMYATKAMDYYRKLLRSKVYNEIKPRIPNKKKAYTSIFQTDNPDTRSQQQRKQNVRRTMEPYGRDNDKEIGLNSSCFNNDVQNRNRQQRKGTYDNNTTLETEPAVINNRTSQNCNGTTNSNKRNIVNENNKKDNETKTYKKEINQSEQKNTKKQEKKDENKTSTFLTINQIGEIDFYPKIMEIEGMD
jgi:hypothetical protein